MCVSACLRVFKRGSHQSGIFHGKNVSSVLSHSQTENEFKQWLERWASRIELKNFYFISSFVVSRLQDFVKTLFIDRMAPTESLLLKSPAVTA